MSGQEEYLDKLLKGLSEEPEDVSEDISFEDADMNLEGLEDIDEEAFFAGESMDLENMDSQLLADLGENLDSESKALEMDAQENAILTEGMPESGMEEADMPEFAMEEADEAEFTGEEPEITKDDVKEAEDSNFEADLDAFSEMEDGEELERLLEALPEENEEPLPEFDAFDSEAEPQEEQESLEMPEETELLEALMEETESEELEIPEGMEPEEDETADIEPEKKEEAEPEEIDDAQALANVLNRFAEEEGTEEEALQDEPFHEEEAFQEELADGEEALQEELTGGEEVLQAQPLGEEQEEGPLAEEAVLDTPQDLGLELEEVEESLEEAEAEIPQKKKKKEKKEKKAKKEKKEKNQEKKPSLFVRLLEDNADDEPTPEELEAEAAKKAEKKEQKEAKKAEAEEKKQQAKEAAEAKKAEKEAEKKRKKEAEEPPEPWPPFTKKIIPMVFLFGAAVVTVIIILSNVLSYSPYISTARQYFDDRQYGKAYEQLMGIEVKEKDQKFFDQVFLMNQLQIKVVSCKNHLLNKEKELAVNDLVQAVLFYNGNLEKAAGLGLEKEFQVVHGEIEAALSESFGISIQEAEELGGITNAEAYQSRIAEIVQ